MQPLQIELLTRAAFLSFGDVIELAGAHQFPINLGTTIRYNDLATRDVAAGGCLLNVAVGLYRVGQQAEESTPASACGRDR